MQSLQVTRWLAAVIMNTGHGQFSILITTYFGLAQNLQGVVGAGNFVLNVMDTSKASSVNQSQDVELFLQGPFVDFEVRQENSFGLGYWPDAPRIVAADSFTLLLLLICAEWST